VDKIVKIDHKDWKNASEVRAVVVEELAK